MDKEPASQAPIIQTYEFGRLPMTDEELRLMEKNRRLTRHITVPLMVLMGACGLAGGIWMIAADTTIIGMGLTFSGLFMLGYGLLYAAETTKPLDRQEKFFVTGVVTGKRKQGSGFTNVYYQLKLNEDKYTCYVSKNDFERLKLGDIVQCDRLEETSIDVDRVVVLGSAKK